MEARRAAALHWRRATPAEVIEESNRVGRDPARYAAFLRRAASRGLALGRSYWPDARPRATPRPTHDGLAACLLAVSFFF